MALFGSFEEVGFSEILKLLAKKEGHLYIEHPTRPFVAVELADGKVQAVWQGQRPMDAVAARVVLMELLGVTDGHFEFHPRLVEKGFGWPVESVLLSKTAVRDEIGARRELLHHPATRFVWCKSTNVEMDEAVLIFARSARPFLGAGKSVAELAKELALSEEHTAYFLSKLELLGCVAVYPQDAQPLPGAQGSNGNSGWSRVVSGLRELKWCQE